MASMEILGCLEPWYCGTLRCSEPWFPGTLGSSEPPEIRYPSVGALGSSKSIGAWRFQVPPGVARWSVGALGSSDSIGAWRYKYETP